MVTSRRAPLAGWLLASCLPLSALAQSSEAPVSLTVKPTRVYAVGEPIELSLVLSNRGTKSLSVFRPRSPQLQWNDWSIGCQVTNPAGHVAELIPAVLYSRAPLPEQADVVRLSPGDAVEIVLILGNEDRPTPPMSDQAVVLALVIPLSLAEEGMTEGPLRQRFGIEGRFSQVSGGQSYLEVIDVSSNVFDSPGSYRVACRWSSATTDVWVPGVGRGLVLEAVDGLFVGEAAGAAALEIRDSAGPGDR